MDEIDVTKELVVILLSLFALETFLDLISFIVYPSIFPNYINTQVIIFLSIILSLSLISIYLSNKNNIYGYLISIILSIFILFSAFTLDENNIIDISVRNIASNYGIFPNPIILFWGIALFLLSLKKIIYIKKMR